MLGLPKDDLLTAFLLFSYDPNLHSIEFAAKHFVTNTGLTKLLEVTSFLTVDLSLLAKGMSADNSITQEALITLIKGSSGLRNLIARSVITDEVLAALTASK